MKIPCKLAKPNNNKMKVKPTQHNGVNVIELDSVRSAKYDDNVERYGDHSHTCFICGKSTAQRTFVHLTTIGFLIPAELDDVDLEFFDLESQGCFPIGSECAKKVGPEFIVTYEI
jgi:hypothetical protein